MCYEDDETWKADLSRWHTCGGLESRREDRGVCLFLPDCLT